MLTEHVRFRSVFWHLRKSNDRLINLDYSYLHILVSIEFVHLVLGCTRAVIKCLLAFPQTYLRLVWCLSNLN